MALTVNSNVSSINAQRNLERSTTALNKSLERLSSGLRINRSGDDAAGLAISEGLRSQIRGLNQAVRNANDGLSMIGTAESAMNTYTSILQRIRELSIQSANDTNSPANRRALDEEVQQQLEELQRISTTVEFNGTRLLDGTFIGKQLQVGAQAGQTIAVTMGDLRTSQIGQIAQTTGSAVSLAGVLNPGDLTLNGTVIDSVASDGVSPSTGNRDQMSALAIANRINQLSAEHGVTAEAQPTVFTAANAIVGGTFNGTTQQLTINGVDVFPGSTTVQASDGDSTLVSLINEKSNQHGVTASISGGMLQLTAADGRNIEIATTGSIGDELGFVGSDGDFTGQQGGTIKLKSPDEINIGGATPAKAGLTSTTINKDPNTAINTVDIRSVGGANSAIDIVDNALGSINEIRAQLGAVTNRLEQTIGNLQAISENLSASDSRIRDADFALETAQFTRNQILQQAGISILSQANTTTQSALSLLQG